MWFLLRYLFMPQNSRKRVQFPDTRVNQPVRGSNPVVNEPRLSTAYSGLPRSTESTQPTTWDASNHMATPSTVTESSCLGVSRAIYAEERTYDA